MSIGWPLSSGLSGHVYLRIGFRKTALLGSLLLIVSGVFFVLLPWPQRLWLIAFDTFLLGAGFGLLSTPSLVGVQSMVSWEKRGVVTGAVMFSRNLGQSLGAAVFGAIFNGSFLQQVANLTKEIDVDTTEIMRTLASPDLAAETRHFLQKAINGSTQWLYYGVILFSFLAFLCLFFMPDHGKPDADAEPS